jgi:hypothetical protein
MTDKRANVVDFCFKCPNFNDCPILKRIGEPFDSIPEDCPLPKWPSVTKRWLIDKADKPIRPDNFNARHEFYKAMLKETGVEVRDET